MLKASIRTADGLKIRKGFPSNVWKPVCALPGDSLPSKPDLKGARSLIKRTGFADQLQKLDWYDKIRPWKRADVQSAKRQIFMKESDAKECTFVPKAFSRVDKKALDLALETHNEMANELYQRPKNDPVKWLEGKGNDFKIVRPMLHKTGVYKRAKQKYKRGLHQEAKNMIKNAFHIESIRNEFEPDRI